MSLLLDAIKLVLLCLGLWGAVTWFGSGAVALVLSTLAIVAAFMGLDSANGHAEQLQRLRDRLRDLEDGINTSYARMESRIERLEEDVRRLDNEVFALTPRQSGNDY